MWKPLDLRARLNPHIEAAATGCIFVKITSCLKFTCQKIPIQLGILTENLFKKKENLWRKKIHCGAEASGKEANLENTVQKRRKDKTKFPSLSSLILWTVDPNMASSLLCQNLGNVGMVVKPCEHHREQTVRFVSCNLTWRHVRTGIKSFYTTLLFKKKEERRL